MDVSALRTLFRSDIRDAVAPYLWTDAEVYSYMDDAQKMFCRLQGGIPDATSDVTQLSFGAGDVYVPISPKIRKIRLATLASDGRSLDILNFEDLQFGRMATGADYGNHPAFRFTEDPGPVRALVVGMDNNAVRLVMVPQAADTINLVVYRLPLNDITGAAGDALEIDEQHHVHLLGWMKHRAHLKQDAETYDKGRADIFKAEFLEYCDMAKAEREMLEHKYRTVSYGGL